MGAQLRSLKDAQTKFRKATMSHAPDDMAYFNNRFHLIMGEMADNPYLWPSLQRLLIDHSRIGHTFYSGQDADMRNRTASACTHHDEFIAAIEDGEADVARGLAFEHWELSRDSIELFVRPDPLELDLGRPLAS